MPKLVFHDSDGVDKTIDLGAEPTLIGRATEAQVQTQDAMVSRRHARILWEGAGYVIEDLGSSNGVYVGTERVQRAPIRPGDDVRCGSLFLKLMPDTTPRPPPPAAPAPLLQSFAPPLGDAYSVAAEDSQVVGGPPQPPPGPPRPAPDYGRATLPPPAPPPSADATDPRHEQAEGALLAAEQRAATAESKLYDLEQQVAELDAKAKAAEAEAQSAKQKATELETTARDGDKYRRQVDQLKADIKRLRGGGGGSSDDTGLTPAADPGELIALTAERDQLKEKVAQLEAQAGNARPASGPDETGLRRKVDQLNSEIRRLRGGQVAPADDPLVKLDELTAKLAKVEAERDALRTGAVDAPAAADSGEDTAKLKRMLEQLTAENRRLRTQAGGGAAPAEDPRVAELTAKLAQAEKDRDAAKKGAAAPPAAGAAKGGSDPATVDATNALNDALSDLRGSLRAANDEIGVLGVEAPGDSVNVLKEALDSATEQLEAARGQLRDLRRHLGIP